MKRKDGAMAMRWPADPIGQRFTPSSPCPECHDPKCRGGYSLDGATIFCEVGLGTRRRVVIDGIVFYSAPNPGVVPPAELLPPPILPMQVRISSNELERLRAAERERDRGRVRIDELTRQVAELQSHIDQMETEPASAAVARLQREVAIARVNYRQVITISERTDLSFQARIIVMKAIDMAAAHPRIAEFGAVVPKSEPAHVRMGELAQLVGASAAQLGPTLKAAAKLGLLTRDERPVGKGDGYRKHIFIGPPTGVPVPVRREEKHAKKRSEQLAKRKTREEQLAGNAATLEAAAQHVHTPGCLVDGHELLGITYFCTVCQHEYSAADLAFPSPKKSGMAPPAIPEKTEGGTDWEF